MKKAFIVTLCMLLTLNLTGCWSSRELNELAFVIGMAADKGTKPGAMLLTAQIAQPSQLQSRSRNGVSSGKAYWNIKNEGDTILSTIRGFSHQSSRRLYFQHNKVLIFGREIAAEGLRQHLDLIARDNEFRNVWIVIAKNKARDILEVETGLQKIPAISVDMLHKTQQFTSETYTIKALDFINRLMSKSTAPVAPFIEVIGEGEEQNMLMSGTAVFKKDKLVGQLNRTETRGLMWVTGEVKTGIIVVDCPCGEGKVELKISCASSTTTPSIKDGIIQLKVAVKEQGSIGSQSCTDNIATSEMSKVLENKQASAIHDEINAALKKAQELNADIFGFGEAVHRKYPEEWADLEGKWNDIFPNIEIEVMVETQIYGTGMISKPID